MTVGYARTSTADQMAGLEAQLRDLEAAHCEKLFQEQVSSVSVRVQLTAALDFLREGDALVVTKLDRLARSVADLLAIVQVLDQKAVGLRILNLGMDTQTPTGKLMLTILGGIAQFEREMMLERQREGVAKAKALGKYKGRQTLSSDIQDQVVALAAEGTAKTKIAQQLKIGEASVFRILAAKKTPQTDLT